ncbi:GNAT family N-acetyltransferase [Robiginitalea sp. M366]|uniref:GNAT family N-acetyltransferase n=1 Tax=Robiginitalea aestuariiviva TaxID=3036903 RepID=UPI00240D1579|nr:GNAT family N-acetyltransferase [Robiginitalea aestuariiviva]MDG1572152.1 GNAT family N-acetyltransferase [Robiginitalea aestuariiviva]
MELLRTDAAHPDFRSLVKRLDADLAVRDGAEHAFYHQYNGLEGLSRAVVCYLDGKAVGCGALKPFGGSALEIKRMFTVPDLRGRGIARSVLAALEAWAGEDGYNRLVLETGLRNPEAVALYTRHGYTRIPNFEPYTGVDNSLCFEKSIRDGR